MEKTNAVRQLDRKKLPYRLHTYEGVISGIDVAKTLAQAQERVFKTLVTVGKSAAHYVFMIPVAEELDLKKAAKAVGEKSIAMLPQKELLPLTGYIHGGCSPIGMKKQLRTVIDEAAFLHETIFFSGGRIGLQIEASLKTLQSVIPLEIHAVT
ncbi:MAG: Cys-tRNA(Pro) deacylase [Ruminococcaceae bacterium]|nr:Cys-tRNA(Pro) deacylase [Oscillospiraceae bacterium]